MVAYAFVPVAGFPQYGGYTFGHITADGVMGQAWLARPGYVPPVPPVVNTHAYRYYRLNITATNYVNNACGLAEIALAEATGSPNTVLGLPVVSNSNYDIGNFPPANLVDNSPTTIWASAAVPVMPITIMFDYGATAGNWKTINEARIAARLGVQDLGDQAPKDFKLQGSDNNTVWTDILSRTGILWNSGEIKFFSTV